MMLSSGVPSLESTSTIHSPVHVGSSVFELHVRQLVLRTGKTTEAF
jgi:hypothetical protein